MSNTPSEALLSGEAIDWNRVDQAIAYINNLDIVEMANHIVNQALEKGPREAYNEAGGARYSLAKAKQHMSYLNATICKESLSTQREQISALELTNEKMRALVREDTPISNSTMSNEPVV